MNTTTIEEVCTGGKRPSDQYGLCRKCEGAPTEILYLGSEEYAVCLDCSVRWPLKAHDPCGPEDGYGDVIAILGKCTSMEPTYYPETLADRARQRDAEQREREQQENRKRRLHSILLAGLTEQERELFLSSVEPEWRSDPDALIHFLRTGRTDYEELLW